MLRSSKSVLRRCLDRDPKTRFHDIADARLEMDEAPDAAAAAGSAAPAAGPRRSALWPALASVLAVVAALGWWRAVVRPDASGADRTTRLSILLPPGYSLPYDDNPVFALSRDARQLVVVGEKEGSTKILVRPFEMAEARPIDGTADAKNPFFSPDGHWIAFFQEGKLKKISVDGGAPVALADVPNSRGGAWLDDDTIVYSPQYTAGL